MVSKYLGSCLCEKVKFEVEGSFETFFLCHCKYCQKDTGSAHAANLFSSNSTLNWLSGVEFIKQFNLPGTRHTKSFCTNCGSAVGSVQNEGKLVVVPAGSLDVPIEVEPTAHLFMASKATWENRLSKVQEFDGFPT